MECSRLLHRIIKLWSVSCKYTSDQYMWSKWGRESLYNKGLVKDRGTATNRNMYDFWERGMQKSRSSVYNAMWNTQNAAHWRHIALAVLYAEKKKWEIHSGMDGQTLN